MKERDTPILCAEIIQGPSETTLPQTPQGPPSHSFPSQNTLDKTGPKKTVLHRRIPVE